MMKKKLGKKIILFIVIALVVMQFIPVTKPETKKDNPNDITKDFHVPQEIATTLKTSCYDCHSMETHYPWYSKVAPVKWMLFNHIEEGREHLNFSEWALLPKEDKLDALDEVTEVLEEGEMPLETYLIMHREAKLSEKQKEDIIIWAESYMEDIFASEPE